MTAAQPCANCPGRVLPTSIVAWGFTGPAGCYTHTGRGAEVETWCDEPQPADERPWDEGVEVIALEIDR